MLDVKEEMHSVQTGHLKWAATALCVFIAGSYLLPTLNLSKLTISFIGIVALFYFSMHRHAFYPLIPSDKILVLFLFITVLSCAWGDTDSLPHALKSSLVALLFVLYVSHFSEGLHRHLNVMLMTMVLSAGILAIVLLYAHFSTHGFNLKQKLQVSYGPIVQTIRTASVFALALLVMIWNVFTNKGGERCACALVFVPVLLAMLLLQSRGTILALSVGVAVLYLGAAGAAAILKGLLVIVPVC